MRLRRDIFSQLRVFQVVFSYLLRKKLLQDAFQKNKQINKKGSEEMERCVFTEIVWLTESDLQRHPGTESAADTEIKESTLNQEGRLYAECLQEQHKARYVKHQCFK